MPRPFETLYALPPITEQNVNLASRMALNAFEDTQVADSILANPIINRPLLGVAVVLDGMSHQVEIDSVMAIAEIGPVDEFESFEMLALKAASRAFWQKNRGVPTDISFEWAVTTLSEEEPFKLSSSSCQGLHVGFAGGWAHHGRQIASAFALSLAGSTGYPMPDVRPIEVDRKLFDRRLSWLNEGQDSGDNTSEHDLQREQFRIILDLIDRT